MIRVVWAVNLAVSPWFRGSAPPVTAVRGHVKQVLLECVVLLSLCLERAAQPQESFQETRWRNKKTPCLFAQFVPQHILQLDFAPRGIENKILLGNSDSSKEIQFQ